MSLSRKALMKAVKVLGAAANDDVGNGRKVRDPLPPAGGRPAHLLDLALQGGFPVKRPFLRGLPHDPFDQVARFVHHRHLFRNDQGTSFIESPIRSASVNNSPRRPCSRFVTHFSMRKGCDFYSPEADTGPRKIIRTAGESYFLRKRPATISKKKSLYSHPKPI